MFLISKRCFWEQNICICFDSINQFQWNIPFTHLHYHRNSKNVTIPTTTTENKWNNQLSMSCVGGVSEVVTDATLWVPNKKEWQDDMKPDPHIFTFLLPWPSQSSAKNAPIGQARALSSMKNCNIAKKKGYHLSFLPEIFI